MKILVVEDEPRLGEQILETLENNGWVPELSQDGIDALYRATSEEWDAIVLDLGLPKTRWFDGSKKAFETKTLIHLW